MSLVRPEPFCERGISDANCTPCGLTENRFNVLVAWQQDSGQPVDTTAPTEEKTYTYGNATWKDLLTAANGSPIVYEGQTLSGTTVSGKVKSGNPICYTNGSKTYTNLTWEHGRQLVSLTTGGKTYTYDYDLNGIRTKKVGNYQSHEYITQNGKVVREIIESPDWDWVLDFVYDNAGSPFALNYSTDGGETFDTYYYILNYQGDVVKLVEADGTVVATYRYNAWGKLYSSSGSMASINPLRYRGYYYDTETGFYYVSSRYYDPEIGRFINADIFVSTGQGILGNNTFAYCNNNPIMYMDSTGCYPLQTAWEFLETWLTGDGDEQYYSEGSRIVKQLKKSKKMQSYIDSAIENYKSGRVTTTGYGEFTAGEDGYELYLSTQHFDYTITVTEETRTAGMWWWKHEETRYTVTVTVHDIYNFDTYREWNSFGNTMNNLAYAYHKLGGGNDYEWFATYTYSTKWTDAP